MILIMIAIDNKLLTIEHVSREGGSHTMPAKHYHEGYEIYYLLEGERYYFIEDRTYRVRKGNLVLINKNILHRTIDTENPDHERILIEFHENFLKPYSKETKDISLYSIFKQKQFVYTLNVEEQLWLENHLFKMIKEKKSKNKGYVSYIRLLLIELLIYFNRQLKIDSISIVEYPDPTHEKMAEIASFISKNYNSDLSLKNVASLFNYSSTYLSRTFKQVTGFSFVEYKNNIRIKEARKLLQQTDLNISDISSMVGYNNLTHFGRIFKEITNYSPLNYRKLMSMKRSSK
ncbi:MAG: helix-turn-helix domain-containing protein [Halanaerobiales bacterium]